MQNMVKHFYHFSPTEEPEATLSPQRLLPSHTRAADTWQVDIPLIAGEALNAAEEIGPTTYLRGVAVSAWAEVRSDESIIPLLIRLDQFGAAVEEVGNYTSTPAAQIPTLRDEKGKEYPFFRKNSQTSGTPYELRELRFAANDPEAGSVTLSIPLMRIREQGRAKVSLPIPGNESVKLDRVVQLGRYSLKLVRAELWARKYELCWPGAKQ